MQFLCNSLHIRQNSLRFFTSWSFTPSLYSGQALRHKNPDPSHCHLTGPVWIRPACLYWFRLAHPNDMPARLRHSPARRASGCVIMLSLSPHCFLAKSRLCKSESKKWGRARWGGQNDIECVSRIATQSDSPPGYAIRTGRAGSPEPNIWFNLQDWTSNGAHATRDIGQGDVRLTFSTSPLLPITTPYALCLEPLTATCNI
jgi:hypothetical protein